MELYTVDIPMGRQREHRQVVIAPIGDIQWSGQRGPTALDALKRHLDRALKLDAIFLGMGDYIDFMSPSNRQRLRSAALYDTAEDVIEEKAMELVYELYEGALKPTKGRWAGLLEGHHLTQLKSGETTDQRLCQMLDAKFLGTSAYVRLAMTCNNTHSNVVIWCHHGVGSGQTAGASLNKLERVSMGWEGADIFMMGHMPKVPATRIPRPYPRWHGHGAPDLVHRDIYLVSTGGFSKSYIVNARDGKIPRGGYAEQKMFNPGVIGAPLIYIQPSVIETGTSRRANRANGPNAKPQHRETVVDIRVEV